MSFFGEIDHMVSCDGDHPLSNDDSMILAVVLIPSWEQPVVGNLSDKLGAFWELVIGSDASARSLGIGWEPGSQKSSLGALKLPKAVVACTPRTRPCACQPTITTYNPPSLRLVQRFDKCGIVATSKQVAVRIGGIVVRCIDCTIR